MMYEEGWYKFDFKNYKCERPENDSVKGLLSVDFIVETDTNLLFIEIKDFDESEKKIQNTNDEAEKVTLRSHYENRIEKDLNKLILKKDKSNEDSVALFRTQIGGKLKDTILRKYVSGYEFKKPVIYIFIMEFVSFGPQEIRILRENIFNGHIPKFTEIKSRKIKIENFEILNVKQFSKKYEFSVYPTNFTNEKS